MSCNLSRDGIPVEDHGPKATIELGLRGEAEDLPCRPQALDFFAGRLLDWHTLLAARAARPRGVPHVGRCQRTGSVLRPSEKEQRAFGSRPRIRDP